MMAESGLCCHVFFMPFLRPEYTMYMFTGICWPIIYIHTHRCAIYKYWIVVILEIAKTCVTNFICYSVSLITSLSICSIIWCISQITLFMLSGCSVVLSIGHTIFWNNIRFYLEINKIVGNDLAPLRNGFAWNSRLINKDLDEGSSICWSSPDVNTITIVQLKL